MGECSYGPCRNGGTCLGSGSDFTCACANGFEGAYIIRNQDQAIDYINKLFFQTFRNMSNKVIINNGLGQGELCEVAVNHCSPSPCEMNSTCSSVNGSWKCSCRPGYLGLRCNLVPCDWLPCHPNEICVNEQRENTDKNHYRSRSLFLLYSGPFPIDCPGCE